MVYGCLGFRVNGLGSKSCLCPVGECETALLPQKRNLLSGHVLIGQSVVAKAREDGRQTGWQRHQSDTRVLPSFSHLDIKQVSLPPATIMYDLNEAKEGP